MDLYFQGLAWFNKGWTPDNLAQARRFCDRALIADPDNVDALVGSAATDIVQGANLFANDRMAAFAAAEAKLTKALSSVPDHARGHELLGLVDILTKRAAEGIAECEHALQLDRNLTDAHFAIGLAKVLVGRAEENRGSRCRGPAPQSARYTCLHLDEYCGLGEAPFGELRASDHVVSQGCLVLL